MTRCRNLEEQLSLYVDDLLDPPAAAEVRVHLEGCAACAGLVSDLTRIARTARLLGPIEPPAHVLTDITAQLPRAEPEIGGGEARGPGRPLWHWAGLAATLVAAVALAYLSGIGTRVAAPVSAPVPAEAHPLATVTAELELAVQHYERAISELESVTAAADAGLDPEVAASVRASLGALDRAIAESRLALDTEPASEPGRVSLFEALRRKIDLLQATALIVNDTQRHSPAEATRPASGVGREL